MDLVTIGKMVMGFGLFLLVTGAILYGVGRVFPGMGSLPGTIKYEGERVRIYFPAGSMIIISIIATILLNVLARLFFKR